MKTKVNRTPRILAVLIALIFSLTMTVPALAAGSLYAGGSGTPTDPYHIQTAEQLQNINQNLGASYVLDNDINLSGVNWTPIGKYIFDIANMTSPEELPAPKPANAFTGDFNGNGHTIKNLSFSTVNPLSAGLFGVVTGNGHIHDVTLQDFNIKGVAMVGSLVGLAFDNAVVENVTLTGNNKTSGIMMVGGLIGGSMNKLFRNLTAQADVTLTLPVMAMYGGVLIGGGQGTSFENCRVTGGSVTASGYRAVGMGGLGGSLVLADHVTNCSVENVTITAGQKACLLGGLGGFLGDQDKQTRVENCKVSNTSIKFGNGSERVGMLTGGGFYYSLFKTEFGGKPTNFAVSNCDVSGTITGDGKMIGAAVGYTTDADAVSNVISNVTCNGSTLTNTVAATSTTVPVSQLM